MPPDPQETDPIALALGLTPEAAKATDERHQAYLSGQDLQSPETQAKWAKALEEKQKNPYYKPLVMGSASTPKRVSKKALAPGGRDYKESDFSLDARKWIAKNFTKSCAFEFKVSETDSIAFDRLETHQKKYLLQAKQEGYVGIIRNDSLHPTLLPFDGYFLKGVAAWVIVMFSAKSRGQRQFFVIDIEKWCEEELLGSGTGGRKSLTAERAGVIGTECTL